jgi:hypothetical protein
MHLKSALPPLAAALALALLSAAPGHAACTTPPASAHSPVAELVARTATIVLAEARTAEERFRVTTTTPSGELKGRPSVKYTFATLEALKGAPAPEFSLEVWLWHPHAGAGAVDDFDHHRDPAWRELGGRVGEVDPDCEVSPRFVPGAHYLLFVEKPWHVLGFEQISTRDDAWLAEVRRLVADGR